MRLKENLFKELDSIRQSIWDFLTKNSDYLESWMTRDNFTELTKRIIARRVNYICSNPTCGKYTQKPDSTDVEGFVNLGDAAHISAASKNGPRYNEKMTRKERRSSNNGIWLCKHCADAVDKEREAFPENTLRIWKRIAETKAARKASEKEDGI
jgi:hypothetical protein